MKIKLIALGNVLMMDDGIAVLTANELKKELSKMDIEVILGETDVGYCISSVSEDDYLFVLDAACLGKLPGDVTEMSLEEFTGMKKGYSQHSISFLDLLKLYYSDIKGTVFAIEVAQVDFGYGLSPALKEKAALITQIISEHISNKLKEMKYA
jgi:hydrogenase maturation protease